MKHQVYMDGDNGPFRCDNCEYYVEEGKCNQKNIIDYARRNMFGLKMTGNMAKVDPAGCSDFFHPKDWK